MAKRGRKSLAVEVDTNKLFTLSFYTLHKALKSKLVSSSKKIEIALAVYTKSLPSKLEHSGEIKGGNTTINIIKTYPVESKVENRIEERIADTGS